MNSIQRADQPVADLRATPSEPVSRPWSDMRSPSDRSSLAASVIVDRCGLAKPIAVLRVRMGFPPETFAMAVQPLIDAYAEYVQPTPVSGYERCGGPGGQLHRGLVTALRALDHRRGQILPRNAVPEVLGALGHRWTYAVFAAALLHDLGGGSPDPPGQLFERWVPASVQAWLDEDPALTAELRAVLSSEAPPGSAIAALVARAAARTWPLFEAPVPPSGARVAPIAGVVESAVEPAAPSPAEDLPEFLDAVQTDAAEPAHRFMDWVRRGIADGTLTVNTSGALVHGVEEGLLLVSPGIFRAYARHDGAGSSEKRDTAKRLQREVLRAGWHLRAESGMNLLGYAWKQDGRADSRIHGIVIVDPRRFVHPVPPINSALTRVAQGEAAPDR
jgi:hypothetical protein